jgi:TonB-linked SusC/RagA family outer membrane protein
MREDGYFTPNVPKYSFRQGTEKPIEGVTTTENATSYRYAYNSSSYTADLILRYIGSFGDHSINAFAGYEQYFYRQSGFSATKKGLLDWSVTDITSGSTMEAMGGEAKQEYAMLSYFGRLSYAYKGKYLLDGNFRSDGSSRFAPEHRWGTFPSFSAGWRISEESFFEPLKSYVNYMKLRASYGSLGNVSSGYYDWQMLYKKINNVLGESVQNGIVTDQLPNYLLSWEKTTTTGIGLDATFLRNRLNVEFDYYVRNTSGILTRATIPALMGNVTAPMMNTAEMRNNGIDLNLTWNDKIGKVRYSVSANASYNINKVTDFQGKLTYEADEKTLDIWGNPTWRYTNLAAASTAPNGNQRRTEGHMIDEWFLRKPYAGNGTYMNSDGSVNPKGGPKDGMIRTKADLDWVRSMIAAGYSFNNKTVNTGSANLWYGERLFADVNGDGRYGNDDDREFTGKSRAPKWIFGFNMNAEWNGFDMNMTWSGRLGSYHYINERGANSSIVSNVKDVLPGDAMNMFYSYDAVKAKNDPNYDPASDPTANYLAKFPRLLTASSTNVDNTFYLYNTSYLQLKSLQIGYTLPKHWVAPAKIGNLRVFVSGENLLTIKASDFPGVDPQLGSDLNIYPVARLFSGGLTVTF